MSPEHVKDVKNNPATAVLTNAGLMLSLPWVITSVLFNLAGKEYNWTYFFVLNFLALMMTVYYLKGNFFKYFVLIVYDR